jgi:hypothetical protein
MEVTILGELSANSYLGIISGSAIIQFFTNSSASGGITTE